MQRPILGVMAVVAASAWSPALAGDLAARSSGAMTITVEIPPIAAALSATQEGAVGLWTASDSRNALLVNLPTTLGDAEEVGAIFHSPAMAVTASLEPNTLVGIARGSATPGNGLTKDSFRLTRLAAAHPIGERPVVTMLLASL